MSHLCSSSSATTRPPPELIYKYISGFDRVSDERVRDHAREWPPRVVPELLTTSVIGCRGPNTILIDSAQLESGEALDKDFREMAAVEIEQFKREMIERTG